jgi:hypothetical protein
LTNPQTHGIINTTKAKETTTMTKKQHYKKVEKKDYERSKRDGSVACKAYKQKKKSFKEFEETY